MSRRAVAFLAAATVVALLGVGVGKVAGAVPTHPTISLSTDQVVPGQKLLVTGSGWPAGTALSATICGADAVSGTEDCAPTATVPAVAPRTGRLSVWLTTALPPKPCPCVIRVTGITGNYSKTIPVTVVGAATAPVPQTTAPAEPDFRVVDLQVAGGTTLASSFGGAAPRTLEFRVQNVGTLTEVPVVLARWGRTGARGTKLIEMPAMQALGAGQSAEVRAHFSLPALSVGWYAVNVKVEVLGFRDVASASASTSVWPVALFVVGLVLLGLIVLGVTRAVRRRRRREVRDDDVAVVPEPPIVGADTRSEYYDGLMDLGAQVRAASAPAGVLAGERHESNDPTTQLK